MGTGVKQRTCNADVLAPYCRDCDLVRFSHHFVWPISFSEASGIFQCFPDRTSFNHVARKLKRRNKRWSGKLWAPPIAQMFAPLLLLSGILLALEGQSCEYPWAGRFSTSEDSTGHDADAGLSNKEYKKFVSGTSEGSFLMVSKPIFASK